MTRVAVAMSGGVDSAVCAALLKEQGYEVIGLHMKLYNMPNQTKSIKSCCSLDEALDAGSICYQLEIPFYVLNFQENFQTQVIDYFISDYEAGRTPNPCVMCNRQIKSQLLLEKVNELDCDYLATGHYAKITYSQDRQIQLCRPKDRQKDQTYFLHGITSKELSQFMFPLQNLEKSQVRSLASKYGFASAQKPESQEICFVPKNYRDFLKGKIKKIQEGHFVDSSGQVLGTHRGLPFYTIGQRKGLGISAAAPYYVVKLDAKRNEIVLGTHEETASQMLQVSRVNWLSISPIMEPIHATVQLRYSHQGEQATITPKGRSRVVIELQNPVHAISPGQAAVFYQDDVVLGGGWIC